MKEGWWIKLGGDAIPVRDHEIAMRRPEVAHRLGVPVSIFNQFGKFERGKDRVRFLRWLMRHVPIIRARGYGVWVGIQWGCADNQTAFTAIHRWGRKICGPCMLLRMTNIATNERINVFWIQFDEAMKAGKPVVSVPVKVVKL